MRIWAALLLLATPALAAAWQTYVNPRFGLVIGVPPGLVAQPDPANGDGRIWSSADGAATLLAWGSNLTSEDFKEDGQMRQQADEDAGWKITYKKGKNLGAPTSGAAWFVYSGTMGGRILYTKSLASCRGTQALYFRIEYPANQQPEYAPIINRLSASMRAAEATDCSATQ